MKQKGRIGQQKQTTKNNKNDKQQKEKPSSRGKKFASKVKVREVRARRKDHTKKKNNRKSTKKSNCRPSPSAKSEKNARLQKKNKINKRLVNDKKGRQKKENIRTKKITKPSNEQDLRLSYSKICKYATKPALRTAKNQCLCKQCNEKRKKEEMSISTINIQKINATSTLDFEKSKTFDKNRPIKKEKESEKASASTSKGETEKDYKTSTDDLEKISQNATTAHICSEPNENKKETKSECFQDEKILNDKPVNCKLKNEPKTQHSSQLPNVSAEATARNKYLPTCRSAKSIPRLPKRKKSKSLLKFVLKKQKLMGLANKEQCGCCQKCIGQLMQFIKVETARQGFAWRSQAQHRHKHRVTSSNKKGSKHKPRKSKLPFVSRGAARKKVKRKQFRPTVVMKKKRETNKRKKSSRKRVKIQKNKAKNLNKLCNTSKPKSEKDEVKSSKTRKFMERRKKNEETSMSLYMLKKIAALENTIQKAVENSRMAPKVSSGMNKSIFSIDNCEKSRTEDKPVTSAIPIDLEKTECTEKYQRLGFPEGASRETSNLGMNDELNEKANAQQLQGETSESNKNLADEVKKDEQSNTEVACISKNSTVAEVGQSTQYMKESSTNTQVFEHYMSRLVGAIGQTMAFGLQANGHLFNHVLTNTRSTGRSSVGTCSFCGSNKQNRPQCNRLSTVKTSPRRLRAIHVTPAVSAGLPSNLRQIQTSKKAEARAKPRNSQNYVHFVLNVGKKNFNARFPKRLWDKTKDKNWRRFVRSEISKLTKKKSDANKLFLKKLLQEKNKIMLRKSRKKKPNRKQANQMQKRGATGWKRMCGNRKSIKAPKFQKNKTLPPKWKLLTNSVVKQLKTTIEKQLIKNIHTEINKKIANQVPMPRAGASLSRCFKSDDNAKADFTAALDLALAPNINGGQNAASADWSNLITSFQTPCPSARMPSFIMMIKSAIDDLEPFGLTGKKAIAKYENFEH